MFAPQATTTIQQFLLQYIFHSDTDTLPLDLDSEHDTIPLDSDTIPLKQTQNYDHDLLQDYAEAFKGHDQDPLCRETPALSTITQYMPTLEKQVLTYIRSELLPFENRSLSALQQYFPTHLMNMSWDQFIANKWAQTENTQDLVELLGELCIYFYQ